MRETRCASAASGAEALRHAMGAPPIANEATLHLSVMCPAAGTFVAERSTGPALLAGAEFAPDVAICRLCCACERSTACYALGRRSMARSGRAAGWSGDVTLTTASQLKPGSQLRRRGGGYYCEQCLPFEATDV